MKIYLFNIHIFKKWNIEYFHFFGIISQNAVLSSTTQHVKPEFGGNWLNNKYDKLIKSQTFVNYNNNMSPFLLINNIFQLSTQLAAKENHRFVPDRPPTLYTLQPPAHFDKLRIIQGHSWHIRMLLYYTNCCIFFILQFLRCCCFCCSFNQLCTFNYL